MKTRFHATSLATALFMLTYAAPTMAGEFGSTGALPVPANRIVGTWIVNGAVSGAACVPASPGPAMPVRSYLVFHSGGTITELPRIPTSVSPAPRTFGVGHWHYDRRTDTYLATFRFDWFANGVLQGYQLVDREVQLSADTETMSGPAVSTRYLENGTELFSQCGSATATRF
jgi:hypothetical protein